MKYLLLLLIFLVGCSSYAYVEIQGVLNESFEVNESTLDIINMTEEKVQAKTTVKYFPRVPKISISLYGVDEQGTKCGIQVNDKVVWIDESSQETVNGLRINVFDVLAIRSKTNPGACEVLIGGHLFYLTTNE